MVIPAAVLAAWSLAMGLPAPAPAGRVEAPARWSAMGHRIVVEIAWDHLTARARAGVLDLLGAERLTDAAMWADRVRPERPETAPFHYVNTPAGTAYDAGRDCPEGRCIVEALGRFHETLADALASRAERVEALRWVLHLVGDIHQPLHVGDQGDRGGNDVTVLWRGRSVNLHALWDGTLVTAWAVDEGRYLSALRAAAARMPLEEREAVAAGSPAGWAAEGNAHAHETVYPGITPGAEVSRAYLLAAGPVLDRVFVRAGLRLARLLNEALDPGEGEAR
jgi:hypothetical protein